MNNPMLQSFLSTALPIVVAVLFGIWTNNRSIDRAIEGTNRAIEGVNRRLDDFARRLDRIETRLDSIDKKLAEHGERIARLELVHR